jgi:endonuclease/exonuclease/phosphatase (EEP) superfamily protein YafD
MKRISWLAAACVAGFGVARLAAADRFRSIEAPVTPLLAFTPHVAVAALSCPVLLRRKSAAVPAALTGAALAAVVLPRAARSAQPPADGPVLRVVTANLMRGNASEEAIISLVQRSAADVLFVQEITDAAVDRFNHAGLTDLLPHQVIDTGDEALSGSGIYARFPLSNGLTLTPISVAQPTARLDLPSGHFADLVCVHPHPPKPLWSRPNIARWRRELTVLPPPADPGVHPPRVLAGDFNATADHVSFRRLLRLGHVDAAIEAGQGLVPTWAPWGSPGLLTIDHVLLDPRCAVLGASVHPLPGSDHLAVYAEFRLPRLTSLLPGELREPVAAPRPTRWAARRAARLRSHARRTPP